MLGEGLILGQPQSQGQCGVRARRAGRAAVGADSLSPAAVRGRPALGCVLLPREAPALVGRSPRALHVLLLSQMWGGRIEAGLRSWLCGPPCHLRSSGLVLQTSYNCGAPRLYGEACHLDTTDGAAVCGVRPSGIWPRCTTQAFPSCGELGLLCSGARTSRRCGSSSCGRGLNSCGVWA